MVNGMAVAVVIGIEVVERGTERREEMIEQGMDVRTTMTRVVVRREVEEQGMVMMKEERGDMARQKQTRLTDGGKNKNGEETGRWMKGGIEEMVRVNETEIGRVGGGMDVMNMMTMMGGENVCRRMMIREEIGRKRVGIMIMMEIMIEDEREGGGEERGRREIEAGRLLTVIGIWRRMRGNMIEASEREIKIETTEEQRKNKMNTMATMMKMVHGKKDGREKKIDDIAAIAWTRMTTGMKQREDARRKKEERKEN